MRKTILFITGTRADFGKLKPLIARVAAAEEAFYYRIFATGMHMLSRYGATVAEVSSTFQNIYPYLNQDPFGSSGMDLAVANTIQGLGHYVREFSTDLIVVHGDRIEALAGAVVGALQNILVAHVEGGEVSGTVDELLRHSISKLSHLHFVANQEARDRLVQMGEQPETVFVIGSPDIDVMLSSSLPSLEEVKTHYEIPFDDYYIFIYHPVTTELTGLAERARRMWEALVTSNRNFVVIHPNNDSGSEILRREMSLQVGNPRFRCLPSMRFESFLTLLKNSQAIIGNSSAGVREAPVYGIPTINIGTRQLNRFTHTSIQNIPDDPAAILDALRKVPERFEPCNHFGDGRSAARFMVALRNETLWETHKQKQFRDLASRPAQVVSLVSEADQVAPRAAQSAAKAPVQTRAAMKAIMYHYVRERSEALPHFRFLDFGNFKKQLDFFDATYGFVTFDEWSRFLKDGSMPETDGKVLLTFDDGLSCHFQYVLPELKSRNLWGIFYVPTSPYTDGSMLDVHRIHLLCGAFDGRELLDYARRIVSAEMVSADARAEFEKQTYLNQVNYDGVSEFKRLLNYFVDYQYRPEILDAIGRKFNFRFDSSNFYLTTTQIEEMAAQNMLIGSHTKTHPVMSRLSAREQSTEIESSFDFLSSVCKLPLRTYCHPYGGFHSFNADTIRLLKDCRVDFSFNVESRGVNSEDRRQSIQFLPRFDCNQFQFGLAS